MDAVDGGHTVIRLNSFSKILAPGLRLGWLMAAPRDVSQIASSGLNSSAGGANPFVAYSTAAFCRNGWLEPHINQLAKVYHHRRDVLLTALASSMPDGVTWTRPEGGFFVWLTLPTPLTAKELLTRAHQQSITFLPGEPFYAEGGGERHLRLPFSFIPPEEMKQGIETLADLIKDMLSE
jgi:DNA-binding transcriptional MocR family regulator